MLYYALPWSQGGISSFQASGQRMRERDGLALKSEEEEWTPRRQTFTCSWYVQLLPKIVLIFFRAQGTLCPDSFSQNIILIVSPFEAPVVSGLKFLQAF